MAIRGNITLTDAATTPVNHVYYPLRSAGDILFWQDRTATPVLAGQNKLSVQQRTATKQSKATKVTWKLELPILEQTSPSTTTGIQPAPTVAYSNLVSIEFVMADRSSLQERKDMLAQVRDLLGEAIVTVQVQDMDLIF